MRHLPDRPSLDFLRKEAKDLLAVLRESNPDASLADAQRALADQYGMRDWVDLKTEAERRAAEAPTAPDGLADALAGAFDLGRVTGAAAPVAFLPMGRCWSITTDRGRWLASTVYDWITEEQAEIGSRLRNSAVAAGIAAPTPVSSAHGRLIEPVHGRNWRVHEWVEVGPAPVTPTPLAVARRVGTILGTLHALAIPSDAPIGEHLTWRRPDADWAKLLERARSADKPWAEQLNETLPILFDLRTIEPSLNGGEFVLCNRVLNAENVRIGHNDELVITEWDFAGSLTPDLEIGWALSQWMLRPSINHKAVAEFRAGYIDAGRWPVLELTSFATAVTGYLNWTYSTICEAISPTDSDHAAFAEREAVDLLNQPMTRTSLEQLLAAVEA